MPKELNICRSKLRRSKNKNKKDFKKCSVAWNN